MSYTARWPGTTSASRRPGTSGRPNWTAGGAVSEEHGATKGVPNPTVFEPTEVLSAIAVNGISVEPGYRLSVVGVDGLPIVIEIGDRLTIAVVKRLHSNLPRPADEPYCNGRPSSPPDLLKLLVRSRAALQKLPYLFNTSAFSTKVNDGMAIRAHWSQIGNGVHLVLRADL